MDEEKIYITPGDTFEVVKDYDGYNAIRIQNSVWVEDPRWLHFGAIDGDKRRQIDGLIDSLVKLRDAKQ